MHFSYVALLLLAASAAAPALAAPTFEKPRDLFFPVVDSDVSAPLALRNLDRLGLQSRYDDQDEHLNARNFLTTILSKIDSAAKAIAKVVLVGVDGRDLGLQSEYDDQDKYLNARDFFDSLFNGDVTTGYDLLHGLGIITRSDAQRRDIELLSRYNDLDARSFLDTLFHGFETLGEAALSAAGVPVEVKRRDIELLSRYDDLDARNFWDSLLNGIESIGNPVLAGAGLPVRQDEHLEARADSVKRIVDGLKKVVNEAKAAGFTTDAERRDIKLLSWDHNQDGHLNSRDFISKIVSVLEIVVQRVAVAAGAESERLAQILNSRNDPSDQTAALLNAILNGLKGSQ